MRPAALLPEMASGVVTTESSCTTRKDQDQDQDQDSNFQHRRSLLHTRLRAMERACWGLKWAEAFE